MKYEQVNNREVIKTKKKVEADAQLLNNVIQKIISSYCRSLDDYVEFITNILHDNQNPPTTEELEDFCMHLSTDIYWASGMCEQLGIRDDIAKALYKETYNNARDAQDKGTVADKNALAELESQHEYLVSVCFTRAYKIMKAKVENAQELLSSCKKVLSHRIAEEELTRIGGK